MGKIFKRTLATIMVVMMVLTSIPLSGFLSLKVDAIEDSITNYNKGEIIEFGTYPQKKVSDETTINNFVGFMKNGDYTNEVCYQNGIIEDCKDGKCF